jgi:hypothetical protein
MMEMKNKVFKLPSKTTKIKTIKSGHLVNAKRKSMYKKSEHIHFDFKYLFTLLISNQLRCEPSSILLSISLLILLIIM